MRNSFFSRHLTLIQLLGNLLVFALFPLFGKEGTSYFPVVFYTGATFLIAGVIALLQIWNSGRIAHFRQHWGEIKTDFLLSTLLNVIVVHGLYFWGISQQTAANAAILMSSEVLFTLLFFSILLGQERLDWKRGLGALSVVLGIVCVFIQDASLALDSGSLLILLGGFFAPIGNYFQKRVLRVIEPVTQLCFRSLLGGSLLLLLSLQFENHAFIYSMTPYHWLVLALGAVLIAYLSKILFLVLIRKIGVGITISSTAGAPVFTFVIASLWLGEHITSLHLLGFVFTFAGVILISLSARELDKVREVLG